MIFVTVGTQLPFDRLIRAVDVWAGGKSYADVFAQIGPAKYQPQFIPWTEFLDADECRRKTEQADVVVAHAGMGSILTSLELGRPVVVMPRLSALGEHRNDHQLDTAKKLLAQGRIFVAFDENQLLEKLDYLSSLKPSDRISVHASSALLNTLRTFVDFEKIELPSTEIAAISSAPVLPEPRRSKRNKLVLNGGTLSPGWGEQPTELPHRGFQDVGLGLEPTTHPNRFGASPADRKLTPSEEIKNFLVSMIVLAGRLRMTDLGTRISRSRLDLPIDKDRTLLTYWRDEAAKLAEEWECENLHVRVLVDQASIIPTLPLGIPGITMTIERDHSEYRGTGGVLHDACARYDDQDWVLVANAAQILFEPLSDIANRLADAGGDINVVNENDGIPNGLILMRAGVLKMVSDVGFHDMKEQVVPAVAGHRMVMVIPQQSSTSPPIHTLKDYTAALRRYHMRGEPVQSIVNSFQETWKSQFSILEQGAFVAETAIVHDSVILEGGAVEKDAVVVRSVIGRGARVAAGKIVVDQVVIG